MNKLDDKPQAASFAMSTASEPDASSLRGARGNTSSGTGLEPVHRLIVLVTIDSDYTVAMQRVWELANAQGSRVLFIGLCKDVTQEPSLRRGLATLAALVQDGKVSAEAKVVIGRNWVDAIKSDWQAGDMVVCLAEHRTGFLHKPLDQILESNLEVPVYILSGLHPQEHPVSNWASQAAAWMGSIGVIAGAFVLQSRIALLPKDWAQTTLLILSVIFEAWLIWVWNSLFS